MTTRALATRFVVAAAIAAALGVLLLGPLAAAPGAALGGAGALIVARRRVRRRAEERSRRLRLALPDALELLASAVDGGAATEAALVRVADFAEPELSALLRGAAGELGPGGTGGALRGLDPALRPLGSLVQQSEELGVPIAAALRLLAADARLRARVEARERAAAAAPKMLLVVGGLLAPAALLVVLGGQVIAMRELIAPVLA